MATSSDIKYVRCDCGSRGYLEHTDKNLSCSRAVSNRSNKSMKIADAVRLVVKYGADDSGWWRYVQLPFGWNPTNPDSPL